MIQNTEGGWEYYSINGDNKYLDGVHTGGRPFNELGENVFESPQAFLDSFLTKTRETKEKKTILFATSLLELVRKSPIVSLFLIIVQQLFRKVY